MGRFRYQAAQTVAGQYFPDPEDRKQVIDMLERDLERGAMGGERKTKALADRERAILEVHNLPWRDSDYLALKAAASDGLALEVESICRWAKRLSPGVERFRGGLSAAAERWLWLLRAEEMYGPAALNAAWTGPEVAANSYQYEALTRTASDFPNIVGEAMSKVFRGHLAALPALWPVWAREVLAERFDVTSVGLDPFSGLEEMLEGSETKELQGADDSGIRYAIRRFGGRSTISRAAILGDDLGAISRPAIRLAEAASRLPDDLACGQLCGNAAAPDGVALFAAAHNNMVNGPLSVGNLDAARAALSAQTSAAGGRLNLKGKVLLCGTEQAALAGSVLREAGNSELRPEDRLVLAIEPRVDALDAGACYLFSDPQRFAGVELAFLAGYREPEFHQKVAFDTLDVKSAVTWSVGVRVVDHRGAVRIAEESGSASGP